LFNIEDESECYSKGNDTNHKNIESIQQKENTNGNKHTNIIFFDKKFDNDTYSKEATIYWIIGNDTIITTFMEQLIIIQSIIYIKEIIIPIKITLCQFKTICVLL